MIHHVVAILSQMLGNLARKIEAGMVRGEVNTHAASLRGLRTVKPQRNYSEYRVSLAEFFFALGDICEHP